MFSSSPRAARGRRTYLSFLALSLLALIPLASAHAQGVGSSRGLPGGGGAHTVKGRVFTPTGKPVEKNVKVVLEGNVIGNKTSATDNDGAFLFTNIPAGNYTLIVDAGKEYEITRETFSIYGTSAAGNYAASQTINVPITLKFKGSGAGSGGSSNAALAGVPKQAADLYSKAREAAGKGDHKKAVEHLNAALAAHPNFALALNELGVQYLMLNQADKAVEPLQAAIKLAPEDFSPHLNLGIALWNQKKAPEAEAQLREALKKNNASPTAHYYLGLSLLGQRKADDAMVEFQEAIKTGGDQMAQAHKMLGGIYWGNKNYKMAADELELYLKLDPKAADAEKIRATVKDLRSKQ